MSGEARERFELALEIRNEYVEEIDRLTTALKDAERREERLRRALEAVFEVAAVANAGDPWYCEHEGVDVGAAFKLAREALQEPAPSDAYLASQRDAALGLQEPAQQGAETAVEGEES